MNKVKFLTGPSLESSNKPEKLVFLLHGYGDTGDNFIFLAKDLYDQNNKINFFAPNAPSTIHEYPSGRQWFDIYPNGINFRSTLAGQKEKEILKQDCFSSLKLIDHYISSLCKKYNLSHNDCFIIGFSQGAMMSFELGRCIENTLAGCILLSGRILPLKSHYNKMFSKTPVLVIHGDLDAIIEPKYFNETCVILKNKGYLFESHLLAGEGHTVSTKTIQLIKKFIKKNL